MSYINMDHAEWMQRHIDSQYRRGAAKNKPPEKLNDFESKVINILGIVGGGIYNAPINPDKICWRYGFNGIAVVWQKELATWDFSALTMLVFLCHEARIRCSIDGCSPHKLRLCFWPRLPDGDIAVRHPNLDEAVKSFRAIFPADHQINFDKAPALQPAEAVAAG